MISDFSSLTPDRVLEAVEESLHQRCNGLIRPLPSYINRVYEIALESGEPLVAKFYRPGRWNREALLEEHAFVQACAHEEIPSVSPSVELGGAADLVSPPTLVMHSGADWVHCLHASTMSAHKPKPLPA
jgi:Ser/Thr protein kinase RdoA (MazF antagonist)